MALDAHQRLNEAQLAIIEGRHEEALRGLIWFHDHALEHNPSLYGVRLSFALGYWAELGKAYPKARRALERLASRKTAALRKGAGTRELFHDVASINEYLDRDRETYRLFRKLATSAPELADQCAGIAMPAVVRARDWALARRYTPEPEARLERLAVDLDEGLQWARTKNSHRNETRTAFIRIYCDSVNLLVKTLRGAGERDRAAAIRKAALKSVKSRHTRSAVAKELAK